MTMFKELIKKVELETYSYTGLHKTNEVMEIHPSGLNDSKLFLHRSKKTGKIIYASIWIKKISIPLEKGLIEDRYKNIYVELIKRI